MNALLSALVLGVLASAPAGAPHITPVVELVPRAKAVREILDGASAFFVREVRLGKAEVAELEARAGWKPEEKKVRLIIGRDAAGKEVGSVLLLKEDSRHGPVLLAVGFEPGGAISRVVITHATEETVPWVRDLLKARFLNAFAGRTASTIAEVSEELEGLGAMPRYMGRVVIRGVQHAAALYAVASAA